MNSQEQFALLLGRIYGQPGKVNLALMQAVADSSGRSLEYGADQAGRRHLLALIAPDYAFTEMRGEAVELTEWHSPDGAARYLDLVCSSEDLAGTFALLADSVVARVQTSDEPPHVALLRSLDDWKRLMRPARSVTEESARGIFGELHVLGMLADVNPHFAVEAWSGPTGSVHDFQTANGDLEVKTSAREGLEIVVSSLAQLDVIDRTQLVLVRVQVVSSPTGMTLSDMANVLAARGCNKAELVRRISEAGVMLGVDRDDHRFVVLGRPILWRVDDGFPGIRSADLPPGRREAISKVSYTLNLALADDPLHEDDALSYMQGMMSA